MTQGERVKEIRKSLNLTLEKFGEPLGVGKTAISNIERNMRNLTEQMLKAICREYGVNEEWLKNGTGEMFIPVDEFSLDEFIKNKKMSDLEAEILKTYFELDPKLRKSLLAHFQKHFIPRNDFSDIPDTPEELEKRFPPVDQEDINNNNAS